MPTISVLIERNIISLKCLAASRDRSLLIDRAHFEFLHLSRGQLEELDRTGRVTVSDLTDATIEEVEVLSSEGQPLLMPSERTG